MANRNAVSAYMSATLEIADQNVREALLDEGLDGFENFIGLTEDDIKDICKNVRKPGGDIPNPNNAAGQPARIPNPGAPVTNPHMKGLLRLRYEVNH